MILMAQNLNQKRSTWYTYNLYMKDRYEDDYFNETKRYTYNSNIRLRVGEYCIVTTSHGLQIAVVYERELWKEHTYEKYPDQRTNRIVQKIHGVDNYKFRTGEVYDGEFYKTEMPLSSFKNLKTVTK